MPELTINKDSLVTIRVRMSDLQGNLLEETPEEVTDVADGKAVLDANHPLAGWGLAFDITVLNVEDTDGKEAVGTDDTVVPSFLGFADKIIDEGDDEDDASEESPEPVTRH